MPKITCLILLSTSVLSGNIACRPAGNAVTAAESKSVTTRQPDANAMEVVKRAEAVLDVLGERRANGEALTPAFVDQYLMWSRRLAEAQCEAVSTKADRIAAIKVHIDRIRASVPLTYSGKVAHPQAEITEYYFVEAKAWLARVECRNIVDLRKTTGAIVNCYAIDVLVDGEVLFNDEPVGGREDDVRRTPYWFHRSPRCRAH
jgi:hypothetical protein